MKKLIGLLALLIMSKPSLASEQPQDQIFQEEAAPCAICLDSYTPENPKATTNCEHPFHKACIQTWVDESQNKNCPICRQPITSLNGTLLPAYIAALAREQASLLYAIQNGNIEGLRQAIAAGININEQIPHPIFAPDSESALMIAVKHGRYAITQLLINLGARLDAQDTHGYTALMKATMHKNHQIVWLLIDSGANLNIQTYESLENHYRYRKKTALMIAVTKCYTEIVKILITAGANVDIQDYNGDTALMLAAQLNNRLGCMQELVIAGADRTLRNNQNQTALDVAIATRYDARTINPLRNGPT